MKRIAVFTVFAMFLGVMMVMAQSGEFVDTPVPSFGYTFNLPTEFELEGKIDKTTTWMYQPGAVGGGALDKIGGGLGLGGGTEKEPALTIYVNVVEMSDVSSKTLYDVNKKSDLDNINGKHPDYTDLQVLEVDDGYAYSYKEIDKADPTEIHRWHVKMFGNDNSYTIGLCGTFEQFTEWGPIYEEVVKSFNLIPEVY